MASEGRNDATASVINVACHTRCEDQPQFETTSYPRGWVNSYADCPLKPGAYRNIERTGRSHSIWLVSPADSNKRAKRLGGLTVGSVHTTGDWIGPVSDWPTTGL